MGDIMAACKEAKMGMEELKMTPKVGGGGAGGGGLGGPAGALARLS
jgi:hypothetical protein